MASEGPLDPGTAVSSPPGVTNWASPSNAATSDNNYASAVSGGTNDSESLVVTNFGFSVPGGAAIDGVEVTVEKKRGASPLLQTEDTAVHLVVGGVIQSGADNKAVSGDWGSSDITETYGGSTDTWGVSLSDTDINASNFGMSFQATGITGLHADVDHITMTVYYTAGATQELVPGMEQVRVARTHEPLFAYEW